jgi:leucyl-tRNA synthetase
MPAYDHIKLEEKWLAKWSAASLENLHPKGEKLYLLFAFAYPSGSGLHVGHVESKTALDILARFYRMQGKNVFFPVGWDAFGLPAENYAIKTGIPPAVTTKNAINTFRSQIKRLAISYDWSKEIATSHPGYYHWTQWLFLQLYKKGLAYQGTGMVNWCPSCQTVLANEQVVNGKCERCGTQVVQKQLKQWYFKITQYQDELLSGLDQVDWPTSTKQQQRDWIGKSKGLQIEFVYQSSQRLQSLPIWTKFWETIFGVTFVVISPEKFNEYGLLDAVPKERRTAVEVYLKASFEKTEEDRKIGEKEKSGPLIPESNYGAAKLASEAFIYAFANVNNIQTWIFRFPNVCGPRATHGVFVNFLRFLKIDQTHIIVAQDGKQAKPYIYVHDLIDAIMLGWYKGLDRINVYNIGNTPLVSVNEILVALLKEKEIKNIDITYTGAPAWPGDVATYEFDDSKIKSLGYKPRFNSKEATDKTAYELVHDAEAGIGI